MKYQPLHPDRLFSVDPSIRSVARELYEGIKGLPIISPHGHTDPNWYADNKRFDNPADFLVTPDHYVFRMLYSQGISLESIGIPAARKEVEVESDPRKIWKIFAENFHLFRSTPSRLWMNHALTEVLGVDEPLNGESADRIYDHIETQLASEAFLPRNLYKRFNIEVLSTTEFAVDTLDAHKTIQAEWDGRVVTTFRPDDVTNPEHPQFREHMQMMAEQTGEDVTSWNCYLDAIRKRRQFFKSMGATATDHGFPTAFTTILPEGQCQELLTKALEGTITSEEAERFRGHMLVENARMSQEDGLVMQIHVGCSRNHNQTVYSRFGADKGCDIPTPVNFVDGFKPLLNEVGNDPNVTIIAFSMDETTYTREIAPLAGHYPALKVGPAWWFHDSPEGMMRYRRQIVETAGFYNTVGFNDDTRAFLSIPARHDVARRVDSNFLAHQVCEHILTIEEAHEVACDLTYNLPKKAYRL